jgi:hypothetical protein
MKSPFLLKIKVKVKVLLAKKIIIWFQEIV